MKSPWDKDERSHDQVQVSFGQLLERSTSAPPISMDQERLGFIHGGEHGARRNFLFGNRNAGENHGDQGLLSGSGRDSAPLQTWGGEHQGRSPNYPSSLLSDALLSSGLNDTSYTGMPSRSASMGFDHSKGTGGNITFADEPPSLAPSQSDSANFLKSSHGVGPPPGLPSGGSTQHQREVLDRDDFSMSRQQLGMRRPASTGLIGGDDHERGSSVLASLGISSRDSGAVRPAPKTLMDLIQEDNMPASHNGDSYSGYNNKSLGLGLTRSHTAGPSFEHGYGAYGERARTASPSRFDSFSTGDRFEHHRHDALPETLGYQSQAQQGIGSLTQQMDRLQVGHGGQQYRTAQHEPQHGASPQYVTIPVSQLHRGQSQMSHPEVGRPQSMYAPAHVSPPPQAHSPHHQHNQFEPQQVYYANSQPTAPLSAVDQGMSSNPTLTMATLPNGQTVYLNMSPYGYSAPQYQPALQSQHGHMVHSQHHQHLGHDYVPSAQGGNQVPYWQGAEGGSMGQSVILNQHGAPVVLQGNTGLDIGSNHGRMKDLDRGGAQKAGGGKARRGGQGSGGGQGGGRRTDARGKHSTTSPLLDEFRSTKNRDWTMLDIKGHVVEFCQDQNGSRFIQQRLEIGNASEQHVVMTEVLPAVRQLRNDVFGNYVVQKLLEFGTPQMKAQLRETLKGEMLPLSLQMYGCRVVQKALEALDEDDLPKLLVEFHHNVLSCIHDQNGNHVIQKCIEVMSTKAKHAYAIHDGERARFFGEQIDFIINDVLDNVMPLSCHPYGCRVLQRILEHCVEPKKVRALDEIAKCHKVLLDDQYGNYVIQHVLQYGRHEDRESVIKIVVANGLLQLSKQKFASNVVEKLLKYGTPSQRNALVREMLKVVDDPNTGGSSVVLLMVRDAYANYVVQTTLDVVSEGEEKRLLLEELNAHSAQLRQYTFAKHIVTKLSS